MKFSLDPMFNENIESIMKQFNLFKKSYFLFIKQMVLEIMVSYFRVEKFEMNPAK